MSPQQLVEGSAQLSREGQGCCVALRPAAQGLPGSRAGEGHLWWFAWRGGGEEGEISPKRAWRRA